MTIRTAEREQIRESYDHEKAIFFKVMDLAQYLIDFEIEEVK